MGRNIRNHPLPRRRDKVYDNSRYDNEEYPYGEVILVERDWSYPENSQVLVKYEHPTHVVRQDGAYVLEYNGNRLWDARKSDFKSENPMYVYTGHEYTWGGNRDLVTYWASDFEGNWSSRAGGSGSWELS